MSIKNIITDNKLAGKRFLITVLVVLVLGFISCSLLILFMMGKITFADISGLLSSAVLGIGAVGGGYLGAQTFTDLRGKKRVRCKYHEHRERYCNTDTGKE
jgi:hypothetical protein